jgi:hypothetical protein
VISQFCFCIAACDILTQNMNCERFFLHFNFLKSDRNFQIALFENFFTNENFSFLFISCTRNRHSTMIEDYIERDDVIRCELDRLALIEVESRLHFLKFVVQTKKFLSDSFCVREIDIQQWSKVIYRKRWCDQMRTL